MTPALQQILHEITVRLTKLETQHTWVGLAKEDRLCAKYMQDAPEGIEAVIDYIEAKLKEKNT
jgi:N-acetylmuramic acid 6-phosphate (MurNAc-6-P) etherase